jgi:hypothetical protein
MDKKEQVKKNDYCVKTCGQELPDNDPEICKSCIKQYQEQPKPEMVVCPKTEQMMICPKAETCDGENCDNGEHKIDYRKPHKKDVACDYHSRTCPACIPVPVSPPEPVKPEEGLLLTDEAIVDFVEDYPEQVYKEFDDIIDHLKFLGDLCEKQLAKLQPELDRREARIKELERQTNPKVIGTVSLADIEKNCERIEAQAKAEAYKTILDDIETHCTSYQWTVKPDYTKRHYPFCPTDLYELKIKYLGTLPLEGKG